MIRTIAYNLPGYGFARASKTEKESWDEMMRTYFENSEQLQAAILLLDIRHKPTKEDIGAARRELSMLRRKTDPIPSRRARCQFRGACLRD